MSTRNARHNDSLFLTQKRQNARGDTSRKIGWGCAASFLKPLPYFRPKSVILSTLFQTWSKIWYPVLDLKPWRVNGARDTPLWHVHDSWRKHQIVLSPNYEELANSSKKKKIHNSRLECTNHTLFQTKMVEIDTLFKFKVDRLQMIVVAKKYIYVSQMFISRMPKMRAIPQLVSAPLNPIAGFQCHAIQNRSK